MSVSSDDLNDESKNNKSQNDNKFKSKVLQSEKSVKLNITDISGNIFEALLNFNDKPQHCFKRLM